MSEHAGMTGRREGVLISMGFWVCIVVYGVRGPGLEAGMTRRAGAEVGFMDGAMGVRVG